MTGIQFAVKYTCLINSSFLWNPTESEIPWLWDEVCWYDSQKWVRVAPFWHLMKLSQPDKHRKIHSTLLVSFFCLARQDWIIPDSITYDFWLNKNWSLSPNTRAELSIGTLLVFQFTYHLNLYYNILQKHLFFIFIINKSMHNVWFPYRIRYYTPVMNNILKSIVFTACQRLLDYPEICV